MIRSARRMVRLCCLCAALACLWAADQAGDPPADPLTAAAYRTAQANLLEQAANDPGNLGKYLDALRSFVAKRPFVRADYEAIAQSGSQAMRFGGDDAAKADPAELQFKADVAAILLTRQEGWETLEAKVARAIHIDQISAVRPLLVALAAEAAAAAPRPGPSNVVVLDPDPATQAKAERAQAEAVARNDAARRRRQAENVRGEVAQTLRRYFVRDCGIAADDEAAVIDLLKKAGCSAREARDIRKVFLVDD